MFEPRSSLSKLKNDMKSMSIKHKGMWNLKGATHVVKLTRFLNA